MNENSVIQVQIPSYKYKFRHTSTNSVIQVQIPLYKYKFRHTSTNSVIQVQIPLYKYKFRHTSTNSVIQVQIPSYKYKFRHTSTNSVIQVQIQTNVQENWSSQVLDLFLMYPPNIYFVAVLTRTMKVKNKHISVRLPNCRTIGLRNQWAV